MPYFARTLQFSIPALLLTLSLGSACGGQSFTSGGGGASGSGASGGGSAAGSGSGGKGNAGSSSKAGSSSGGTGSGGVTSGGMAFGGSSGGSACDAPPESGNCDAYFRVWHHDAETGICRPFAYGGCGGNANRYESLEACQKACSGGQPNYDACTQPSDCIVTGTRCCGLCDGPSLSKHDFIAYNLKYDGFQSCPDIACAPCPAPPLGTGTLSNFIAGCVNQQCTVIDIRESSLTACDFDSECRIRNGSGCCEGCGGGSDAIAVRNDGSFEKQVCSGGVIACPDCDPRPNPSAGAVCNDGHCAVAFVSAGG